MDLKYWYIYHYVIFLECFLHLQFISECSRNFDKDLKGFARGNFSTPLVNGRYPRDADCVWRIKVNKNYTIVVQFEKLDLEEDKKCKYDFVAFYDDYYAAPENYSTSELLRYCGNNTPPHAYPPYGYPVNSSSNEITVRFKTDSTNERLGFTAIWYTVLKCT